MLPKPFFLLLALLTLSLPLFPQPHALNGAWHFRTDRYHQGEKAAWYAPETSVAGWDQLPVPGNWDLENEYADYAGTAWYRRSFEAPADWRGQRVRLYFESVYNEAKVWVNGKLVTQNALGFLPFWADVQAELNYGGENVIAVQVDNVFKRGAIWNWGGIRRPVWLEVTPMARLERQQVTAVPDLVKGTAEVSVEVFASNAAREMADLRYRLTVSREGETVFQTKKAQPLPLPGGGEARESFSFSLQKQDVALWHVNHPHLYTCRVDLLDGDQVIHSLEDRFGIRKIEVDGYELKLNGEAIRPVGFNLVPEDRVTGNTLPLWRIKQDVDMMKSLGVNLARLSHLPLPKDFLDYLDESGIMVFEEVSLWGKDAMVDPDHPTPKAWLERMIAWKYNHPSVIGWSVGNEIGYLNANPKVMKYVEGATAQAKRLDPQRLVINVSFSAQSQERDPVEFSDLILYNRYGSWGKDAEKVNQLHPGKPIFMAEFGKELNSEDPNAAEIDIAGMMQAMRGRPYLIGASLWTFNDYRSFWQSNPTWSTPPSQNRAWGIVNTFRQKKRPFYDFKREFAPVQGFAVAMTGDKAARVQLSPRDSFDIPAYPLRDYRLVWAGFGANDSALTGGWFELPELLPGGQGWSGEVSWENASLTKIEVHLLDPQGYSVRDSTVHFEAPNSPKIKVVHTAEKQARVVFEPVPNARDYVLRYGKPGAPAQFSEPTINDFIEVEGLEGFTDYEFAVIARNEAGESVPSTPVTARTDEDELPPVIWATVPADSAIFIGYTVGRTDYLYEIAYGFAPGQYVDTLALRNVGVLKLPHLPNGKPVYFRLRRRMQWGFASEWTDERVAVPGKPGTPARINGRIQQGNEAMLHVTPAPQATGYQLILSQGGRLLRQVEVPQAQVRFIHLEEVPPEPWEATLKGT